MQKAERGSVRVRALEQSRFAAQSGQHLKLKRAYYLTTTPNLIVWQCYQEMQTGRDRMDRLGVQPIQCLESAESS